MNSYPKAQKEAVIKKLIELRSDSNPVVGSIAEIARQAGIPADTVYSWNRKMRESAKALENQSVSPKRKSMSSMAKFAAVVATASMSELQLGEYLRSNGILKEELDAWRAICESANDTAAANAQKYRSALTAEVARSRKLEAELTRKEKALAETASLLVLRGKAQAIWGEHGED
jgi:hypothetical protein